MAISKASRVTEARRYFVIAIDEVRDGKIMGAVFHTEHAEPSSFCSMMDLVWIVEAISDELRCPVSLMKQRQFKKAMAIERKPTIAGDGGKVRRGRLATLKMKLSYRHYASWQGVAVWVEEEETKVFHSFLELVRYISQIVGLEKGWGIGQKGPLAHKVPVDAHASKLLRGQFIAFANSQPLKFRSVTELAKSLDSMVAANDAGMWPIYLQEKRLESVYWPKGRKASFVVKIRFCEHMTWQGTVFWCEEKQIVNFRSFLELIKLMDLAVLNHDPWVGDDVACME